MKITLPLEMERDNRHDPLGESIRVAVREIKGALFYEVGPGKRVHVKLETEFVTFGGVGDREEPVITIETDVVTSSDADLRV